MLNTSVWGISKCSAVSADVLLPVRSEGEQGIWAEGKESEAQGHVFLQDSGVKTESRASVGSCSGAGIWNTSLELAFDFQILSFRTGLCRVDTDGSHLYQF